MLEPKGNPVEPDILELPDTLSLDHHRLGPGLAPKRQPDVLIHLDKGVELRGRIRKERIRPEEDVLYLVLLLVVEDLLAHLLRRPLAEKALHPEHFVLPGRVAEPAGIRAPAVRLHREHPVDPAPPPAGGSTGGQK